MSPFVPISELLGEKKGVGEGGMMSCELFGGTTFRICREVA